MALSATNCGYRECGERLPYDAYAAPRGQRFCHERHAILELLAATLAELRDPDRDPADQRRAAVEALLEAEWFCLDATPGPRIPRRLPDPA